MKMADSPFDTHLCPTCDTTKQIDDICLECNAPESEPICTRCDLPTSDDVDEYGECELCRHISYRESEDELHHRESLEGQFR